MPNFSHDGLTFHYLDEGEGLPFVFQHGLGGDVAQMRDLYAPAPGVRFLALDSRGHGDTRPLGDPAGLTFDSLADDVVALLDQLDIESAVVGGLSMGAGIALNLALRYPQRVRGLILLRPAWLDAPLPENLRVFTEVGRLIREYGAEAGLAQFQAGESYAALRRDYPSTADSLLMQFTHPRAEETALKLERIPRDAPNRDHEAWRAIHVPTHILFTDIDPVHPTEYAHRLAAAIPGAALREVTSKAVDVEGYTQDIRREVGQFLRDRLQG